MRYAIVIEKASSNYAAYVPDLPGCVAAGATIEETAVMIREAIEFHLEGLRADSLPIPPPNSQVEYVKVYAYRNSRYNPQEEHTSAESPGWQINCFASYNYAWYLCRL